MLMELHIKNLATIEELRLELQAGLTILSGNEGTGKSLVVDALCLLAGDRASVNMIRSGTNAALVEGIFSFEPDNVYLTTVMADAGIGVEPDNTVIMTRELQGQGRGIARVNGRAVPVSLLRDIGERLMDIHSQTEHLSLLNPHRQMDMLDGYGGLLTLRGQLGSKVLQLREKSRELNTLEENSNQRQHDFLEYQVTEIERAGIQPGEDNALQQERRVLQKAHELKEACYAAYSLINTDEQSSSSLVHQSVKALQSAAAIDPTLDAHVETLISVAAQIEETSRDINRYAESLENNTDRLQYVEARLELLRQLKHKYGATVEDVIRFADKARNELLALEWQGERRQRLAAECEDIQKEASRLAESLSGARQQAAGNLTQLVNQELADLDMPWAKFEICVTQEECPDGLTACGGRYAFSQYGIDLIEFQASTNPREPLRPLADIVSGGETCRFMLALKSAARLGDGMPTLIFDEIDAGVSGRGARVIGDKLESLAAGRQVICVTHLPQISCFGHHHYRMIKEISGGRAVSRVERLVGDARIEELAAMLGNSSKDTMLKTAQELLDGARKNDRECIIIN